MEYTNQDAVRTRKGKYGKISMIMLFMFDFFSQNTFIY